MCTFEPSLKYIPIGIGPMFIGGSPGVDVPEAMHMPFIHVHDRHSAIERPPHTASAEGIIPLHTMDVSIVHITHCASVKDPHVVLCTGHAQNSSRTARAVCIRGIFVGGLVYLV